MLRVEPRARLLDVWGGSTVLTNEYSFGLDGWGATSENNPLASRTGAQPDFFKVKLGFTRFQRMPWHTAASVNVETQWAGSKLLPQEELYLGGADSVRGYPEGDYLADHGIITRIDYLMPCYFLPRAWHVPGSRTPLRDQMYVGPFVDHGYGQLRSVSTGENQTSNMLSTGIGMQWNVKDDLALQLGWGYTLGDRPLTDDTRSAMYLSFRYQL